MHNSWNRNNIQGTPFASWIFIQSLYQPLTGLFCTIVGLERKKNILGFLTYNLGRGEWILSRPPLSLSTLPQLESLIQTRLCKYNGIFLFSFRYPRQSNREINEDLCSFCLCLRGCVCS